MNSGRSGDYLEDRALVGDFLRRREEDAFRALYRRHAPAVNRVVLRMLRGNQRDAEDVLQSAWIRAIEHLDGFRWESSLRSWITGIALNCAREFLRRSRRSQVSGLPEIEETGAHRELPKEISRIDLERAIASLPDRYREVLVLHDIEGYTHAEIGGLLGIESGTSKSQLSRARRAIRLQLSGAGYGAG